MAVTAAFAAVGDKFLGIAEAAGQFRQRQRFGERFGPVHIFRATVQKYSLFL